MQILIQAVIGLLLLFIAYVDFKERAVPVYALISLFVASVIYGINEAGWRITVLYVLINGGLIVLLVLLLAGYYAIREKAGSKFINQKLGLGDMFFWLGITPLFSTINFILFFVCSLVIILLITIFQLAWKKNLNSIPLAGHQAVILLWITLLNGLFFKYNFYIDLPLFNFMRLN